MSEKSLGIGIIGTGFLGKAHAFACHCAPAAIAKGVVTQVGFNDIKNSKLKLAREMIAAGGDRLST